MRSDLVGGAVFTIQGDGLALGQQGIDALPLPEEALGTRVFVDGKAVKLLWVAPTYIVFPAPWAMLSGFAEVYVRTTQGEGNRIRKSALIGIPDLLLQLRKEPVTGRLARIPIEKCQLLKPVWQPRQDRLQPAAFQRRLACSAARSASLESRRPGVEG